MENANAHMRIITCASYYGTGSSAVTDFFSEFDNCSSMGDHEFRFIYDPDGIRDLEYNLIERNDRHNTSNAIKRYIRFVKQFNGGFIRKGYQRYMDDAFLRYSKEYISNITELKCKSYWYYDRIEKGKLFYLFDSALGKMGFKLFPNCYVSLLNLMNEQAYYSAIEASEFYQYTRDYIKKVIASMNKRNTEFIMVDQLLPPSNINSYLRYFDDDIRVIVCDRDPRDIYISGIEIWRDDRVIPNQCIEDFCKWYEIIRRHRKRETYDPKKVYLLRFEDLVYRYEETAPKLMEFVGITPDHHTMPKSHFDPAVSVKNTNLVVRYPKYKKEVSYIEKELGEYCYDF